MSLTEEIIPLSPHGAGPEYEDGLRDILQAIKPSRFLLSVYDWATGSLCGSVEIPRLEGQDGTRNIPWNSGSDREKTPLIGKGRNCL